MTQTAGYEKPGDERLFLWIAVVLAAVFGAGGIFLIIALNRHENVAGIKPDHPRQLADFSLTDRTGRTVTRAELDGKILVVGFLFTSCSLTCPEVNRRMAEIQRRTAGQPDVRLVSLTVDPRTDTPAALLKYGERFGADTNRWLLLTGDKATLYHLIGTSFLAQDLNDPFTYMPGNFSHTDRIALVDAQGNVRGYFDGLNPNTATAVVGEISRLRK
jgi:cytochrome oxidase Cu insertion factor (SCO1/SenC/PrrC family)